MSSACKESRWPLRAAYKMPSRPQSVSRRISRNRMPNDSTAEAVCVAVVCLPAPLFLPFLSLSEIKKPRAIFLISAPSLFSRPPARRLLVASTFTGRLSEERRQQKPP